jgi:Holliday junction resolvase RusA-like endonuclease
MGQDGKVHTLRVDIPFLPPTSNHIYVTDWRRKMRFLTKEARAFQHRFSAEVVPRYLNLISLLDVVTTYSVAYHFYFERDDVLTKSFGQKDGAKSRYKKMDVENRIKLIADCFFKAIGIDDSQVFCEVSYKNVCRPNMQPQVRIFLQRTDPGVFGVTWHTCLTTENT